MELDSTLTMAMPPLVGIFAVVRPMAVLDTEMLSKAEGS